MTQSDERVFNWGNMARVLAIIVIIPAVYAFAVPPLLGMALSYNHPGPIAGSQIYRWLFWGMAWGLILWQGSWMRQGGGDRILDDMAVTGFIAALILLGVKIVTWFVYQPAIECTVPWEQVIDVYTQCTAIGPITIIDLLAAAVSLVLSFIGALANRF